MSLDQMNQQSLSRRPLGQNNSQNPVSLGSRIAVKKDVKITAKADSTGVENDKSMIIKHHHSVKKPQTASVAKRNLRERTRVRGVNDTFGKLKLHVPDMKSKSSKVETLRGAIDYIKRLKELLGQDIDYTAMGSIKFEDDDMTDDSSAFSDVNDSSFSNTEFEHSPNSQDRNIHPMVYHLPPSSPYQLESSHILPNTHLILPPMSTLSPNPKRLSITLPSLNSGITNETKPLDKLPSQNSPSKDKCFEKLPPMCITAPSWWPQK